MHHEGRVYPIAAITVTDSSHAPQRAYAYALSTAAVAEMLALVFDNVPPPATLAAEVPNSAVFAFSATAAGFDLLPPRDQAVLSAVGDLTGTPLHGVELRVGVLPSAEDLLVLRPGSEASSWLLFSLLIVIGTLIVLAVLLVRKEAELVRMRADFVSSVSHELRTPLAQIRMFTETLLLGRVRSDVERRRSLEIIDQEARRLTNLVENVLSFSKAEGGRQPRLAPEPTLFAADVRAAIESFAPMCRIRSVEIRDELQENIAAHMDRNALRQILINLIDNALKYGPAGQRVTVGAALFGEAARLWVDDEGQGIPEAERERVFDSFFRMQRDVDARMAGSGIGLAVVRELVRLHGGRAWAEAAPGGGARMMVEFPDAFLRIDTTESDLAAAS
jgi:signal transduction histidine kinase